MLLQTFEMIYHTTNASVSKSLKISRHLLVTSSILNVNVSTILKYLVAACNAYDNRVGLSASLGLCKRCDLMAQCSTACI